MKLLLYTIFALTLFISLNNLSAQWNPIIPLVQLTGNSLHPNFTETELDYSLISHDIWLTWDNGTDDTKNIYVTYIDDYICGSPIAVTSDSVIHQKPNIEGTEDIVIVIWESNKRGTFDILYSIYSDNSWTYYQFITRDSVDNKNPVLQIFTKLNKWCAIAVWERQGKLQWSQFNSHNWTAPLFIETGVDSAHNAKLRAGYSLPFLVWEGLNRENWDIYCSWFVEFIKTALVFRLMAAAMASKFSEKSPLVGTTRGTP